MKKLRNALLVSSMLVFGSILVACGVDSSNSSTDASNPEGTGGSEKVYSINIAYGNQPGEFIDEAAKKWKELAEERSEGALELNLYPSSQLGSEKDVVEQAIMGSNVIVLTGYDFLMDYVPDIGILTAPYLTDDFDDLLYLTTTDWFKDLEDQLTDHKIEIVTTNTIYGKRHLMTKTEVLSPEDLKGLKIRVPNNNMYIQVFKAFGAAPTPMPLADLYTSLQQGMVDGAENPLPVLQGSKTNEVAKYLSLTEHTKIISPWIAGTDFLNNLPEELVTILKETGDEATEYGNQVAEKQTEQVLADFEAEGITINEVDLAPFQEKASSVYEAFPNWSPGLYDTVQELLNNR